MQFPRDVGIIYNDVFTRRKVLNINSYINTIERNKRRDVYVSLFSDIQIHEGMFDKVYIDIDGGIKEANRTMQTLVKKIEEKYDVKPLVLCSGVHGYHIYTYYPLVNIEGWLTIREWVLRLCDEICSELLKKYNDDMRKVEREFNMLYVDTQVVGDISRVVRPPYTINHKANKGYVVPIDVDMSVDDIKKRVKYPEEVEIYIEVSKKIRDELVEINKEVKRRLKKSIVVEVNSDKLVEELELLLKVANRVRDGRKRMLSFLIIPRLLWLGYTPEETEAWCKAWVEETGAEYRRYASLVRSMIRRTIRGSQEGEMWRPWSFRTFFYENPELLDEVGEK